MKMLFFRCLLFLLCAGATAPCAFGQKELIDSIEPSKTGAAAKADELLFDAIKAKMHDDDKLATELLEKYVAARPEVSDGFYELSKLYYNYKNLEKSEEAIKKAIALDGENKWYKEQYATILAERGAELEAAKIMADLTAADPDDRSYPLLAAEYYERAHKYDEAITYLDKALTQTGMDEDIMMRKMQLYLDMNNVDKAAEVINKLIAGEPKNGRYYKLLGELYDNNKLPEKAAAVYQKAQKDLPGDPSVQLGLAEHYMKAGDTASSMAYLKKAIVNNDLEQEAQLEILEAYLQSLPNDSVMKAQGLPIIRQVVAQHPDDAEVIAYYGEVMERSNLRDSALIAYKRSLTIKPSNFAVWVRLLENYLDKPSADSLIKYSEKAMRLFPTQAVASFYNGIGHLNKKEYPAAIKAINRAIDMQPETDKQRLADMYSVLGDIYHSNKQDDLSDKAFDKALQFDANNATILNNYSYYLSERGKKLDEAEKMSKRSLDLRPDEATFLDTYGWILYKKGDFEKARQYVQQAITKMGAGADATLYDHLGDIYYKLNAKDKAVENWKTAKEKGGDDPQIDKKIKEGKLYE